MTPFVVLTALAVGLLLGAEERGSRLGVWLAKPAAAAGFVAAALAVGALDSGYGSWILVGLVLSAAGDVLLIPRGARIWFASGLASFLLAHLAYALAFAVRGLDPVVVAAASVPAVAAVFLATRWLAPHVPDPLRIPVRIYTVAIMVMVACAAAASARAGEPRMLAGALLFAVSDLAVARERFVAPSFANKSWGLPLYFGGQLLLAASVAAL